MADGSMSEVGDREEEVVEEAETEDMLDDYYIVNSFCI
jgi:hypothetical protein